MKIYMKKIEGERGMNRRWWSRHSPFGVGEAVVDKTKVHNVGRAERMTTKWWVRSVKKGRGKYRNVRGSRAKFWENYSRGDGGVSRGKPSSQSQQHPPPPPSDAKPLVAAEFGAAAACAVTWKAFLFWMPAPSALFRFALRQTTTINS